MSSHEFVLLADDDRDVTEALAMLLERRGRTTIVCPDVESAEIALARFPVTHVITDVQFSGAFGFEGLRFLTHVHATVPDARIVMISGHATDALRANALSHGAHAVLAKPFAFDELEQALGTSGEEEGDPYVVVRAPSLEEILSEGLLQIAFQPIVELKDGERTPFGFEALCRVGGLWAAGADAVFAYAARRGMLKELNLAALVRAIEAAPVLPPSAAIFINVDPSAFVPLLPAIVMSAAQRASIPLSRIVLEVTERSAFTDPALVAPLFDELRAAGVRFALDDHGSAYSHLAIMTSLRPSFVKISNTFGTAIEEDEVKQLIVTHVAAMARDFGCRTVLEGIECQATAREAARLGLDFAQGYHFGRPQSASHWNQEAA